MKRLLLLVVLAVCTCAVSRAQISFEGNRPVFSLQGTGVLAAPDEGLWSVAIGWENDWMCGWRHADPQKMEKSGEWTILSGRMNLEGGDLLLRDSYRQVRDGLVQCVRRYEWTGNQVLPNVTLSVRMKMEGEKMMPLLPGILYYGNKNGAKVNPQIIRSIMENRASSRFSRSIVILCLLRCSRMLKRDMQQLSTQFRVLYGVRSWLTSGGLWVLRRRKAAASS